MAKRPNEEDGTVAEVLNEAEEGSALVVSKKARTDDGEKQLITADVGG